MEYEILEYKILENDSRVNLEKEVNLFLKDGWKLQGGVCCDTYDGTSYYSQAMLMMIKK